MTSREKAKEYIEHGGVPCRTSSFGDADILAMSPSYQATFDALVAAGELAERGISYNYPSSNVLSFMAIIGNEINRAGRREKSTPSKRVKMLNEKLRQ